MTDELRVVRAQLGERAALNRARRLLRDHLTERGLRP
jgi:hypothetical protein